MFERNKVYANQAYWDAVGNMDGNVVRSNIPNGGWWFFRWYAGLPTPPRTAAVGKTEAQLVRLVELRSKLLTLHHTPIDTLATRRHTAETTRCPTTEAPVAGPLPLAFRPSSVSHASAGNPT